jgi:hypothetical protein
LSRRTRIKVAALSLKNVRRSDVLITHMVAMVLALLFSYVVTAYHLANILKREAEIFAEYIDRTFTNLETHIELVASSIIALPEQENVAAIAAILRYFYIKGADINNDEKMHISGIWWYMPGKSLYVSQYGAVKGDTLDSHLPEQALREKNRSFFTSEMNAINVVEYIIFSKAAWKEGDRYIGSLHAKIDLSVVLHNLQQFKLETWQVSLVPAEALLPLKNGQSHKLRTIPYTLHVTYQKNYAQLLAEHHLIPVAVSFYVLILVGVLVIKWRFRQLLRSYKETIEANDQHIQDLHLEKQAVANALNKENAILSLQLQVSQQRENLLNGHIASNAQHAEELATTIDSYIAAVTLSEMDKAGLNEAQIEILRLIRMQTLELATFTLHHTNDPLDSSAICREALGLCADEITLREITVTSTFKEQLPSLFLAAGDYLKLVLGVLQRALADVTKGGAIDLLLEPSKHKKAQGVLLTITTKGLGLTDAMLYQVLKPYENKTHFLCDYIAPNLSTIKNAVKTIAGHIEHSHAVAQGSIFKLWIPLTPSSHVQKQPLKKKIPGNVVRLFT